MNKEIKTFEAAFALSATEKEKAFFANTELMAALEPDEVAYKRAKIITRAINTNPGTGKVWEPNWNNRKEVKYFPWFEIEADAKRPSGFGFSYTYYDFWYSDSAVGSRLCFESSEGCLHALEYFSDEYKPFILILK